MRARGLGEIQTSSQAGGMTSERVRSSCSGRLLVVTVAGRDRALASAVDRLMRSSHVHGITLSH